MRYTIQIDATSDAFMDYPKVELARILRDVAKRVEGGEPPAFNLRDENGNTVGHITVIQEDLRD